MTELELALMDAKQVWLNAGDAVLAKTRLLSIADG